MTDTQEPTLAEYIDAVLKARDLSIRAFATYADISHSTLRRILAGEPADHETYQKLARYLKKRVLDIYVMAGLIPPDELLEEEGKAEESATEVDTITEMMLDEIELLMRDLPPEMQQKILAMVRLEHQFNQGQTSGSEPEQARKAS